jgi:hypothetical protein
MKLCDPAVPVAVNSSVLDNYETPCNETRIPLGTQVFRDVMLCHWVIGSHHFEAEGIMTLPNIRNHSLINTALCLRRIEPTAASL